MSAANSLIALSYTPHNTTVKTVSSADALSSVFRKIRISKSLLPRPLFPLRNLAVVVDAGIDCANLASVCASAAVIPSAALSLPRDTQVAWLHAGSGVCSPEDLLYPVFNLISTMPLISSSVVIGDILRTEGEFPGAAVAPTARTAMRLTALKRMLENCIVFFVFWFRLFL